jgi:heptosyltransferase-2
MQNEPQRVAVFLPTWVGDVVMATPALCALREQWSGARIAYVGRPAALDTLSGTDAADEMLADGSSHKARLRGLMGLCLRLRKFGADLAVLLPNSFRTALAARLGGAERVAGYNRDGRRILLSEHLDPPRDAGGRYMPVPALDYYNALVRSLGVPCESRRLSLPVRAEDEAEADGLLQQAGVDRTRPIVMLNPGASFGTSKMWDPRRYAALADMLAERRGAQIIVNAAPGERQVARWVVECMRQPPAINLGEYRNRLGLVKSLLRRCRLLVTNDTGARHLAAAAGIGVVTVFGSTDPEWSRIDYDRERIVRVAAECSPCQRKLCPQAPGPKYHQCMTAIVPEAVFAAAEELLDSKAEAAR